MEPTISYLWRLVGEALIPLFRAAPGFEARLTPRATLVLTGEPVADLNFAVFIDGPDAEERLQEYGQVIQASQLPILILLTAEVSGQLGPAVSELGLHRAGQLPLMTYRPSSIDVNPGEYEVERVADEQSLREVTRIAASAFDLPLGPLDRVNQAELLDSPGLDIFLAHKNGRPVSTVQTTRTGSFVGIWVMGTPAEYQRQGAGQALLEHVLAYHTDRGASVFYLLATQAGKPLYERIGFATVAEAEVWVSGHSTQVSGHS